MVKHSPFRVGDRDPTPSVHHREGPACAAVSPDGKWSCTWHRGHSAGVAHVAGNGRTIEAAW